MKRKARVTSENTIATTRYAANIIASHPSRSSSRKRPNQNPLAPNVCRSDGLSTMSQQNALIPNKNKNARMFSATADLTPRCSGSEE